MLFSQVLSILFLERIPIKLRLGLTFAVNTVFTACIGVLPSLLQTSQAYLVVLGMCLVYGVSLALLQLTLYGEAGPSMKNTTAFMVGNGLSSLLVNILRIFVLIFIKDLA